MTEDLGGAKVYLKREDLNHTGAHKINNVPRSGASGKENGEDPGHRRDRRGTARRCYGHCGGADADGM